MTGFGSQLRVSSRWIAGDEGPDALIDGWCQAAPEDWGCAAGCLESAQYPVGGLLALHARLREARERVLPPGPGPKPGVHVAGAGPAGLIHGVTLALQGAPSCILIPTSAASAADAGPRAGASVLVSERRAAHARDIYFDLTPRAVGGSPSVALLLSWGLSDSLGALAAVHALNGTRVFPPEGETVAFLLAAPAEGEQDDAPSPHRSRYAALWRSLPLADSLVTVRCATLEALLSRALLLAGGALRCDDPVVGAAPAFARPAPGADLVVVATGPRGLPVEAGAPAAWPGERLPIRRVRVPTAAEGAPADTVAVLPGLAQVTLLAWLAPHANGALAPCLPVPWHKACAAHSPLPASLCVRCAGSCPGVQEGRGGGDVSPFLDDRPLPGVAAAFKRFFAPVCELQVLLRAQRGEALWQARHAGRKSSPCGLGEETAALLLDVLARTLRAPPATHDALCTLLEGGESGESGVKVRAGGRLGAVVKQDPPPDAGLARRQVLRLELTRAAEVVTAPGAAARARSPCARALAVGDAEVTAFYRLGVGVNNAWRSAEEMAGLVPALRACLEGEGRGPGALAWRRWLQAREDASRRRVDRLGEEMALVMAAEVHCPDTVVFGTEPFTLRGPGEGYAPDTWRAVLPRCAFGAGGDDVGGAKRASGA